ncbi:MAG: hypothetical protein K0R51_3056, partial [Cytophagaceae bacterium]|nr:hypothetical protein [Cytophagaceae bacterium]
SPTGTNTYTVTGTDANGCKNTASRTITVNTLPTVTANTTTPSICIGESATLSGGGAVSYAWTGSVTDNVSFNPTVTDTYTVTGTDANGCKNTASATITVNDLPIVTANTTTPSICIGESATLSGGGAVSYVWTGSVTDDVSFDPTVTDTYTVTGTDANGCKNTASATITVNDLPTVTANTTTPIICSGESATLSGGGAVSYVWTGSVTDNVSFDPTVTDTYTVTGTDANGCKNTASATITVNDLPSTATTVNETTITVDLAGATYQWVSDCGVSNDVLDNETGQSFTASVEGNYSVIVTENGCSATSSCIAILFTGIDDAEHSSLINIYPNPNNGSFTIHSSIGGSYKVINELGQTVDTFQLDGINDLNVDFTNIKNGMYMLVRIDNPDNRTISKKIVISR